MRRGDVIGLLGNAGNSVGPHLHFHVGDRNALNESVAVPYVFDAFRFYGRGRPAQEACARVGRRSAARFRWATR